MKRPPVGAILLVGLAEIGLLSLGIWQLQRRTWKTELIATLDSRQAMPEAPLPAAPSDDWAWRPVTVSGHFVPHSAILQGRPHTGAVGGAVLLVLEPSDGAPPVLVDAGWAQLPLASPPVVPSGPVTVHGIARVPPPPGWLTLPNQPAQHQWWSIDLASLATEFGEASLAPLYVQATAPVLDGAAPEPARPELRNEHLNYAIFWFTLSVVLAVVAFLRSRPKSSDLPQQG